MSPRVLVQQKDYAAHRGVSQPQVTRWKQAGRLVMDPTGHLVDVVASDALLDQVLDPGRGGVRHGRQRSPAPVCGREEPAGGALPLEAPAGAASGPGGPGAERIAYSLEAAREKRAAAGLRELDLAERAGELILVDVAKTEIALRVRAAKDLLAGRSRRLAALLALEADPAKVEAILDADYREICAALAGRATPASEAAA